MSIKYLNKAFDYPLNDTGAKFVLVVLCDHADSEGFCYPSMETISKHTGQSIRTIQRAVQKLEELGVIRREERRNAFGYKSSDAYYVLGDKLSPDNYDVPHRSNCPVHIESKDSIEPSIEPPVTQKKHSLTFNQFWERYPRTRRGCKDDAWKAWGKALKKGHTEQQIMEGLKKYETSRDVARGFAKGASVWLNGSHFLDEPYQESMGHSSGGNAGGNRGFDALAAAAREISEDVEEQELERLKHTNHGLYLQRRYGYNGGGNNLEGGSTAALTHQPNAAPAGTGSDQES